MGSTKRYTYTRSSKRKGFAGTRYVKTAKSSTPTTDEINADAQRSGASAKKLNISTQSAIDNPTETCLENCNFIVESDLFMSLILSIGSCIDCQSGTSLQLHGVIRECDRLQMQRVENESDVIPF
eukprot:TCONS_00044971-protein